MIENFLESSKYAQNLFKIDDSYINLKLNDNKNFDDDLEKNKFLEAVELIKTIEAEGIANNVPIITREVLNYMIFSAKNINAKNILEVGTATGFSGIF